MGTNYYAHIKVIDEDIKKLKKDGFRMDFCCFNKYPIHLGKSSIGWKFYLAYNKGLYYKNWNQMKNWLKGKIIKDEYGRILSLKEFIDLVEVKQKEEKPTFLEDFRAREDYRKEFTINGYIFCDYEFS